MSTYRNHLPQASGKIFITDGGLETTLIFEQGYDLPAFAAFDVLRREEGHRVLQAYFEKYIGLARKNGVGIVLESPTWRASRDWGARIGYDTKALEAVNRRSVDLLSDIRQWYGTGDTPMVISGCIGPRGDGYTVADKMTADQAEAYHREQIHTLSQTDADLVTAFTINYVEEAIGITRAAQSVDMPVVIGFTLETDGRLPSGQHFGDAVTAVDQTTGAGPAYYMINCAHPTHFMHIFANGGPWVERVRAIRANASSKSHTELEASEELDAGNPSDLGAHYARLKTMLPQLTVLGGCCGTDHRHVDAICRSVMLH